MNEYVYRHGEFLHRTEIWSGNLRDKVQKKKQKAETLAFWPLTTNKKANEGRATREWMELRSTSIRYPALFRFFAGKTVRPSDFHIPELPPTRFLPQKSSSSTDSSLPDVAGNSGGTFDMLHTKQNRLQSSSKLGEGILAGTAS